MASANKRLRMLDSANQLDAPTRAKLNQVFDEIDRELAALRELVLTLKDRIDTAGIP